MNNFVVGIKKFLSNKNTVTVVGAILIIVVLYVGYNMRVKQAITPVTVPYAIETISPATKITEDMLGTIEVPPSMLKGDVIRTASEIVDKYTAADSVVAEGSLFYGRSIVSKDALPGSIILEYPKDYVLYNLSVDMATTYSNSMVPGNYIDIYLKVMNKVDENSNATVEDRIMVGKLLENVKVLAVFDSAGDSVFANTDEKKTPSQVIFAVPEEYHILLRKAEFLRAYDSEIIPVPTAESLEENPGDVELSNNDLKDFINRVTAMTEADLQATQ